MTTEHILGLLPHRYPFLLIDRVLEISDDRVPGAQERDDQRALLPGPLPEAAGDAGRTADRGDGAVRRHPGMGGEASTGRVRNCTRRPCSRSRWPKRGGHPDEYIDGQSSRRGFRLLYKYRTYCPKYGQ